MSHRLEEHDHMFSAIQAPWHGLSNSEAMNSMNELNNLMTELNSDNASGGKVHLVNACPCCGEREADKLVWQKDSDKVRCSSCGTEYQP